MKAFGDLSVSHAMVFRYHSRFAAGEESIEDESKAEVQEQQKQMKTSLRWQLF